MKVTPVKFQNKQSLDFIKELRKNVDSYFAENNLTKYADGRMISKMIILFIVYLGAYGLIISDSFSVWPMLLLAVVMGIGKAGIGFSVAHDAIHGTFSSNNNVNRIIGLSMNLIGGSDYMWKITHNHVHHTYTNIHNHDEDITVTSLVRLCPNADHLWFHRFQHLYFPFIYSLTTVSWVLTKDIKNLFQKNIGPLDTRKHPLKEVIILVVSKLMYYAYTIAIPLLVLDITIVQFLIGFFVMHLTAGFILGIIFQLAHVVEEVDFPLPDENNMMQDGWAIHQMKTTSDFGRTNKILEWYVGGLNFQVEHHLFPNICSVHYPAISKIVEEVANKHGVPYHYHRTFRQAVGSHFRTLRAFGNPERVPSLA
jgi:linoleoyl-CoA desaturase